MGFLLLLPVECRERCSVSGVFLSQKARRLLSGLLARLIPLLSEESGVELLLPNDFLLSVARVHRATKRAVLFTAHTLPVRRTPTPPRSFYPPLLFLPI